MVNIYGLLNSKTNELRYVGQTKYDIVTRLKGHIKDSKRYHYSVSNWIKGLIKLGQKPKVILLEITNDAWEESEKFWIAYAKFLGCNLLNHTEGGDSVKGFRLTKETKEKLRIANTGKSPSIETREKLRIIGEQVPKEQLAFYKWGLGKPRTEEDKRKISLGHIGVCHTQEIREQIRKKLTGYKHTDEAKENMSKASFGRKHTEVTKEKMRSAALIREQNKRITPTNPQSTLPDGSPAGAPQFQ